MDILWRVPEEMICPTLHWPEPCIWEEQPLNHFASFIRVFETELGILVVRFNKVQEEGA